MTLASLGLSFPNTGAHSSHSPVMPGPHSCPFLCGHEFALAVTDQATTAPPPNRPAVDLRVNDALTEKNM